LCGDLKLLGDLGNGEELSLGQRSAAAPSVEVVCPVRLALRQHLAFSGR
jgi:hypothetical protein